MIIWIHHALFVDRGRVTHLRQSTAQFWYSAWPLFEPTQDFYQLRYSEHPYGIIKHPGFKDIYLKIEPDILLCINPKHEYISAN